MPVRNIVLQQDDPSGGPTLSAQSQTLLDQAAIAAP